MHLRPGKAPVLLREGFSWGALLLGPLWLAGTGAPIAAALLLLGWAVVPGLGGLLGGGLLGGTLAAGLCLLQGLNGRDWRRWDLERRGYALAHVVGGRDELTAWARLLASRPDLVRVMAT